MTHKPSKKRKLADMKNYDEAEYRAWKLFSRKTGTHPESFLDGFKAGWEARKP